MDSNTIIGYVLTGVGGIALGYTLAWLFSYEWNDIDNHTPNAGT